MRHVIDTIIASCLLFAPLAGAQNYSIAPGAAGSVDNGAMPMKAGQRPAAKELREGRNPAGKSPVSQRLRVSLVEEGAGTEPVAADAQPAEVATAEAPSLHEVLVTAEKVTESAFNVPMGLAVLTGDRLVRLQSYRFEDYAGTVPGLTLMDVGPANSQLVIRGVSSGDIPVNSSVATYIDESPFTTQGAFGGSQFVAPNVDAFDMKRIEVLKGPQGTLYGANALGGLLKFVTNAPDPSAFAATVASGVSSIYNGGVGFDEHAMVNLPLTSGTALRLVGYDSLYPGFIDDPTRGLSDINGLRFAGGRASLLFQPNDEFSARLNAFYQRKSWGDVSFGDEEVYSGTLAPVYGDLKTGGWLESQPGHTTVQLFNLTMNWNGEFAKLISATSYSKEEDEFVNDLSKDFETLLTGIFGHPYGMTSISDIPIQSLTEELRLSSQTEGRLQWLIGGYFTNKSSNNAQFIYPIDAVAHVVVYDFTPFLGDIFIPLHYREYAGFANLDYHFTPSVDVALGGRYSTNKQTGSETASGLFFGSVNYGVNSSESVFTYSGDIRWHFVPKSMLYARVATGFAPGGPVDVVPTAPVPHSYRSSKTYDYEIGLKSRWLDDRLSVDISAFDIDWRNIQLATAIGGYSVIANGGTARSDGAEFEFEYILARGLTGSLNGAYTKAYLTQSTAAATNGHLGDRLPLVPMWQSSARLEYEHSLGGDYSWFSGVDWRFTGNRFGDFSNSGPRVEMPNASIFDVRAGLESSRWSLKLYVKNLANRLAVEDTTSETLAGNSGVLDATVYAPRTVGVEATARFR